MRQLDILLVDDDEVDIMNVQRSFRKQNITHKLTIRKDGVEALEYLRTPNGPKPQVIILDINMPRMTGLEFLKQLRADTELGSITVFIMSTSSNPSDKAAAYELNVAGYVIKPLSADEFSNSLGRLIRFVDVCDFP